MSEQRVAARYAKSLLDLAQEQGTLDTVQQDMELFGKTLEGSRDLRLALRNPIVQHDKKLNILRRLFEGKVSDLTMKFFTIITQKNRETALEFIASEFQTQFNVLRNIQTADVTTATPLTPELREQVQRLVQEQTGGGTVELREHVDASLIGGIVLRLGDRQIDDSVRTRLNRLRTTFKQNPYQAQL
ncbi:ATP synthase F1 subunit delta [Hymenobacter busanensis]|uniref:ATP synthase subunit delta n=1 Tax=Hymenobacter busanensis TaxID=2607656 RepID=A0A7L5A3U6_9BACT|nr:ATP synthase F1 subunit delta [Hymenobacter busanensis]KAA9331475.1 ATP synthase F1 subunit delta [Hymenobacter busanensis]QHJ08630.1 ATP synthase F1 subunit delta [Hymenobacter busanensis]